MAVEPVRIPATTYHGGFSFVSQVSDGHGTLVIDDDTFTIEGAGRDTLTRNASALPPFEICRTRAIAAIEFTSEQVAKSKVAAAVVFGVLGSTASKATMDRVTLEVILKSGETGYLTVDGQPMASVLAKLTRWMREHGISRGAPAL